MDFFNDKIGRERHRKYYLPTVEIKDYNVIMEKNILSSQ